MAHPDVALPHRSALPRVSLRQARLATGLVLFAFVLTHFLNHAVGLVSIDAMEGVRDLRTAITRSWPGTVILLGAFLIHFALGIVRAGSTLDQRSWPELHRALDRTIGPYLSRTLVVAIVTTGLVAVLLPASRVPFGIATALFAGVLGISIAINVPINRTVASWTATPTSWRTVRARWGSFQHMRALLAVAGFALVLAGTAHAA